MKFGGFNDVELTLRSGVGGAEPPFEGPRVKRVGFRTELEKKEDSSFKESRGGGPKNQPNSRSISKKAHALYAQNIQIPCLFALLLWSDQNLLILLTQIRKGVSTNHYKTLLIKTSSYFLTIKILEKYYENEQ